MIRRVAVACCLACRVSSYDLSRGLYVIRWRRTYDDAPPEFALHDCSVTNALV